MTDSEGVESQPLLPNDARHHWFRVLRHAGFNLKHIRLRTRTSATGSLTAAAAKIGGVLG